MKASEGLQTPRPHTDTLPTVSIHHPLFGIEITYKSFQFSHRYFRKFSLFKNFPATQVFKWVYRYSADPCIIASRAIGTSKKRMLSPPSIGFKDSGFPKASHVKIKELYHQNFFALHQSLLLGIIIICSPFSRSDAAPQNISLSSPSEVSSVLSTH